MKKNEKYTEAEVEQMAIAFAALADELNEQEQKNAKLLEYVGKLELLLQEKDEEIRGLYVATCLKFGTMTGPLAMEMVLPLRNTARDIVKGYGLTLTDRVDRNERTVRVVKLGFGVC